MKRFLMVAMVALSMAVFVPGMSLAGEHGGKEHGGSAAGGAGHSGAAMEGSHGHDMGEVAATLTQAADELRGSNPDLAAKLDQLAEEMGE